MQHPQKSSTNSLENPQKHHKIAGKSSKSSQNRWKIRQAFGLEAWWDNEQRWFVICIVSLVEIVSFRWPSVPNGWKLEVGKSFWDHIFLDFEPSFLHYFFILFRPHLYRFQDRPMCRKPLFLQVQTHFRTTLKSIDFDLILTSQKSPKSMKNTNFQTTYFSCFSDVGNVKTSIYPCKTQYIIEVHFLSFLCFSWFFITFYASTFRGCFYRFLMIPADSKTLQNGTRPSEMMLSLWYNTTFEKNMIFH